MYWPGATATLRGPAGFEAESAQVAATNRTGSAVLEGPVSTAGIPTGLPLPCSDDPELFFAESPDDVESAKELCQGCPAPPSCRPGEHGRDPDWSPAAVQR